MADIMVEWSEPRIGSDLKEKPDPQPAVKEKPDPDSTLEKHQDPDSQPWYPWPIGHDCLDIQ